MTWILGAVQAGLGIWQAVKASQDKAPIDKVKPSTVPNELYENKILANDLRGDALREKGTQEGSALDRDVARRTMGAGISSSPAGRMQTDIASNIEKGVDINSIYNDYRRSLSETAKLEMGINSEIAKTKLDVYGQNLTLAGAKQDLYNTRQAAWGAMIDAGVSNVAGALQSRSNEFYLNKTTGGETAQKLKDEAFKYMFDDEREKVNRMIDQGNFDGAQRIINKYK